MPTASESDKRIKFPIESPCFTIHQVDLSGQEELPHWLPLQRMADRAKGECLGPGGINELMRRIQNQLVDHGYVTTRVLAPAQDLKSGILKLTVIAGTVRHIRLTPESRRYIQLFTVLPAREGQLLDLRDIEVGLENLHRLPMVQAKMDIVPAEVPGQSDLVVDWYQERHWRLGASLDDSGSKSTGHYQGGLTLFIDNPFSLSDMFYVSASHDLHRGSEKGTRNLTGNYSLPFGYWNMGLTLSSYRYHQTVAGLNQDYLYRGESQNATLQISRLLHRNSRQKTTLVYDVTTRGSRNYINDTQVQVQKRNTTAWRAGLDHQHYVGASILEASIRYQRGTRWDSV